MYQGVKNDHKIPPVSSYTEAQRALEVWDSKPRRGNQIAQVIEHSNGNIAFRLYCTDVVEWEPDGSVLVDNFGTRTTSEFAGRFLPSGIWLNHPVTIRGNTSGHNTIQFVSNRGENYRHAHSICQGNVVRFTQQDDLWLPDPDTCYDITLPDGVDRKVARDLAQTYHFAEFEMWLTMALPVLDDVEHEYWDAEECMDALKQRDWRRAVGHMPVIEETGKFNNDKNANPLPIHTARNEYISMGCLAKLKLAIWDEHDLLKTRTEKVWPYSEFRRKMQRLREMVTLDISGTTSMGPQ